MLARVVFVVAFLVGCTDSAEPLGHRASDAGDVDASSDATRVEGDAAMVGLDAGSLAPWTFGRIGAGFRYSCAIDAGGHIACWGRNDVGQTSPPQGTFESLSVGFDHACAVNDDGEALCWGSIRGGLRLTQGGRYSQVASGTAHTCFLTDSGFVQCVPLGTSNASACDLSQMQTRCGQTEPPAGSFLQVNAGWFHTCGIRAGARAVSCWGLDDYAQASALPGTFAQIDAGFALSCGVQVDGTLVCWGRDADLAPAGLFRQVTLGNAHGCALDRSGHVSCWGFNNLGQASPPADEFIEIAAGQLHTCGILAQGRVKCWGLDDDGELDAPPDFVAF